MPRYELDGQVAIVTGAGRGIGRATALRLAREGASVTVADINEANAKGVAEEIESTAGTAHPVTVDVTNKSDTERMVSETVARFGKLNILVNNAGIAIIASLMDTDEATWDALMNVNAKGVLLCSQAAARQMIDQGNGGQHHQQRLRRRQNRTGQRHTAWCLCCQQTRRCRAHEAVRVGIIAARDSGQLCVPWDRRHTDVGLN